MNTGRRIHFAGIVAGPLSVSIISSNTNVKRVRETKSVSITSIKDNAKTAEGVHFAFMMLKLIVASNAKGALCVNIIG